MTCSYQFPRPALTVECVVFGLDENDLKVLLIQRDLDPFSGKWAIPGGFLNVGESVDEAARRVLTEETAVRRVFLEQLYTFGHPNRDPREHVVSVAYYALVRLSDHRVQAATEARNAAWFAMDAAPQLAFDHPKILHMAHERLRNIVRYRPIGFELLPPKFPLRTLQHLYEVILERPLDKRNFRKKILSMDVLEDLDELETNVTHRAARLYRFDKSKYNQLVQDGFHFEI